LNVQKTVAEATKKAAEAGEKAAKAEVKAATVTPAAKVEPEPAAPAM